MILTILFVYPSTVTLSADAVPAPGGYVVPVGGNITFTCSSSLENSGVFWTVDLIVQDGTARLTPSAGLDIEQVSSPETSPLANPATITIGNITLENNRSFVSCSKDSLLTSKASILVEGEVPIQIILIIHKGAVIYSMKTGTSMHTSLCNTQPVLTMLILFFLYNYIFYIMCACMCVGIIAICSCDNSTPSITIILAIFIHS